MVMWYRKEPSSPLRHQRFTSIPSTLTIPIVFDPNDLSMPTAENLSNPTKCCHFLSENALVLENQLHEWNCFYSLQVLCRNAIFACQMANNDRHELMWPQWEFAIRYRLIVVWLQEIDDDYKNFCITIQILTVDFYSNLHI